LFHQLLIMIMYKKTRSKKYLMLGESKIKLTLIWLNTNTKNFVSDFFLVYDPLKALLSIAFFFIRSEIYAYALNLWYKCT